MPEPCIGGWTIETLRQHISSILDERRNQILGLLVERDKHLDERFKAQEIALYKAEDLLRQYKADANHLRTMFVPHEEYSQAHRQLIDKTETIMASSNHRMDSMDRERNLINNRVIQLESRIGYMSVTVVLSIVAILTAAGSILMDFITKH